MDVVVKPRDVDARRRADAAGASSTSTGRYFDREMERLFARMWVCAGRTEQVDRPGRFFVRELLGESIIVTRDASPAVERVLQRLPPSRHAAVHRSRGDVRRQHPVSLSRVDLRPRRTAGRRAAHGRSAALPQGGLPAAPRPRRRLGRPHLPQPRRAPRRRSRPSSPICPAKFRPWRMQDLRLGHRIVYDVKANWKLIIQNYNECLHCPNLHPALNKLSHYLSGENEPLHATYMGGRMDLRPGVDTLSMDGTLPAGVPAGAVSRGPAARLLLRDLSEHAPQPAPRLHAGAHAVADRARPHDQHLRVALPA